MYALLSDHKSRTGKALDKNNALIFAADIGRQEGVDGNQVLRAALGRTNRSASQLQSTRRQMGEVKPSRIVYQDQKVDLIALNLMTSTQLCNRPWRKQVGVVAHGGLDYV